MRQTSAMENFLSKQLFRMKFEATENRGLESKEKLIEKLIDNGIRFSYNSCELAALNRQFVSLLFISIIKVIQGCWCNLLVGYISKISTFVSISRWSELKLQLLWIIDAVSCPTHAVMISFTARTKFYIVDLCWYLTSISVLPALNLSAYKKYLCCRLHRFYHGTLHFFQAVA